MFKFLIKKITSIIALLAILVQSLGPSLVFSSLAYAQEATTLPVESSTPSPSPDATQSPAESPLPQPTVEPSPTVSPTSEPSPSVEPSATPSEIPSPTPEVSPSQSPTPSSSDNQIPQATPAPSIDITPSPTPVVTPTTTQEDNGQLNVSLLHNNSPPLKSLDLSYSSDSSATLTTDKADYAPTDTAIISGSGFKSNHQYKIVVSSQDAPAITHEDTITTDNQGSFVYVYQLDGNYRPNYLVEVKNGDGIIASTTFTDSASPSLSWPSSWITPNACTIDPSGDENPDSIDLVGTSGSPAVGFSSDSNYQYFREKVHGNPGSVSNLDEKAWVLLFQTSTPQYQYLGSLNGKDSKVQLWQNTSPAGAVDFSPLLNDPAETKVWEGSSIDYARVTAAGGGDYFIDWAIPISQLTSRGITTSTTKFFATSANANNFNKDHLNCYEAISDLSIIKTDSPDPVNSGGVLTYTLSVHNNGPDTATGVIVNDTLPAGYAVTTVSPSQGSCSDITAPTLQCELGSISNGGNASVTIVGVITGSGIITNNASISTTTLDTNTSNNSDTEDTTVVQKGSLIVHKEFTDQHSNSGITINLSGDASGTQTTNGSGDATFSNLNAGTYTAHATEPSGYYESANTCVNVSVVAGQTANCTITDSPIKGTITVHKVLVGTSTPLTGFCFTLSSDPGNGQVCADANGDAVFTNVPAGTYTATETASTANYSQTNTTCNVGMVIVQNNDSKSCTVTNTRDTGTITINKTIDPASDSGKFNLQINEETAGSGVNVGDGGTTGAITKDTGSYNISETAGTDTNLDNYDSTYSCNNRESGSGTSVKVTLSKNQNLICTFTNTLKRGSILGTKQEVNSDESFVSNLLGWVIELWKDGLKVDQTTTDSSGNFSFSNLLPGVYSLVEQLQNGWTQIFSPSDVTLTPGQSSVDNNFGNFKNGTISGAKFEDSNGNGSWDEGELKLSDWTIFIDQNENSSWDEGEPKTTTTEEGYSFPSLKPGTYSVCEAEQDGWTRSYPAGNCQTIEINESNQQSTANFGNYRKGSISGEKWNDVNGNREKDCSVNEETEQRSCESTLAGWHIQLFQDNDGEKGDQVGEDEVTDENGNYSFSDLTPGQYFVCEVNQQGWEQTYPNPNNDSRFSRCHKITIGSGEEITGQNFGNRSTTPIIHISKTNNTGGGNLHPGDSVGYTITVSLDSKGGSAINVQVTDLLPDGFKYHVGSWGASSNIHGALSLSEPTYHSPGVWSIGNMDPGEIVTLTYTADISGDEQAGLYKDVAWAQGTSVDSSTVLALAIDPGVLDTNFVGTSVNVIRDSQNGASINIESTKQGEVLGASISLPSTGAQTKWLMLAILMLIGGAALTVAGLKLRREK